MAEAAAGFLEQLKSCIVWSWTYLWTVWFFIVLFLVYILRVPLRINDNLGTGRAGGGGGPGRPSPAPEIICKVKYLIPPGYSLRPWQLRRQFPQGLMRTHSISDILDPSIIENNRRNQRGWKCSSVLECLPCM
ncbi:hypothetical protein STEG23_034991 [Scotinomys teguina]